jgi:pimeloyl-ACP methyl ester carboxylesterase
MGKFFTASDGAKIHYVDEGKGPTLLYVHAYTQTLLRIKPFLDALSPHWRVVSFDQRGWGETPIQGAMTLDQSAKDAKELIEYLGLKNVYYVGYSMGVAVYFAYVRQFGTRHIERAAMIDMTPCFINKGDWKLGFAQGWYTDEQYHKDIAILDKSLRAFNISFFYETTFPNKASNPRDFTPTEEKYKKLEDFFKDFPGGANAIINLPDEFKATYRAYWISMCENDFREVLPKVDKPFGIIFGRPGSLYDENTANYIASKVQKPVLYPIDNNGTHMIPVTHADEVLQKLLEFGKKSF